MRYLVAWKIYPAYGDPEGMDIIEASNETEAWEKCEQKNRPITRQGDFFATPIDVTSQYDLLTEMTMGWSKNERILMTEILKRMP